MKGKLLSYIDIRLNHHCHDPVEQMVYFIARLSLTASPVAWTVKNAESKADKPFLTYDEARDYIKQNGEGGDYIAPLFATVKMELFGEDVRHLLLTPSPEQCDSRFEINFIRAAIRKPLHPEKEMALIIFICRQIFMFSSYWRRLFAPSNLKFYLCEKTGDLFKSPTKYESDDQLKRRAI